MAASTSHQNDEAAISSVSAPIIQPISDSVSEDSAPIAFEEFDEEEVYEDAFDDTSTIAQSIDLEQSFRDCDIALKKFFNNDMKGAIAIMKPWAHISLYHSLGVAIFEFIPAVLTFDAAQIKTAICAINTCISICLKNRRHHTFVESIGSIIKKPKYAAYSDLEAHAELCYAEALLLQAALSVIEGEDFAGMVLGTLKIKNCYKSYQLCRNLNEVKKWDSVNSMSHFKSGVRLGTATFNLMISLMPPKIIAFLEFVGFTADKYYGLMELDKGANSAGMRAVLCDLTLLAYHLVICQFIGGGGDIVYAELRLNDLLKNYPNSVWFLAFQARRQFLQSRLDESIYTYNHAIRQQEDDFRQFRLLCYWELMWVHGLKMNYQESANYAEKLVTENAWSKTTHIYIRAAMLMQIDPSQLNRGEQAMITDLIRIAPRYKVRLAGKSLPMEKFVIRRCARYEAQGQRLLLPGLELLCLWNLFPTLSNDKPHMQRLITLIERTIEDVQSSSSDWMGVYIADNMALLHFIYGCALYAIDLPLSAINEFKRVLEFKSLIKEDAFLIPYAVCELAMCYYHIGDIKNSFIFLAEAKQKYSGYNLESRLHFRVHARLDMVRQISEAVKQRPSPGTPSAYLVI